MIIGIAGRLGAGKSELSNALLFYHNYSRFSFASYLKQILSDVYDLPLDLFYNTEAKNAKLPKPLIWDKSIASELFKIADIDYLYNIEDRKFESIRDAMQYVGTDVLQKYDTNFHVKKTMESLDLSKNYVCDDVRFRHEHWAINHVQGKMFYVISPNNLKIVSNHASETSIKWYECDYNIVNNKPLEKYKHEFLLMVDKIKTSPHGKTKHEKQDVAFINETESAAWLFGIICSKGILQYDTSIEQNVICLNNISDTYINEIKQICPININGNNTITISNPYVIENLKQWDLSVDNLSKWKEKDGIYNIPLIVKHNPNYLLLWREGFLANCAI